MKSEDEIVKKCRIGNKPKGDYYATIDYLITVEDADKVIVSGIGPKVKKAWQIADKFVEISNGIEIERFDDWEAENGQNGVHIYLEVR